jgi:hypothetical protein
MEITIPRSVPFQHSYVSKWLQLRNAFSVGVSASNSDRSAIYVKVWGGLGRGGAKLGQLLATSRKRARSAHPTGLPFRVRHPHYRSHF